MFCQLKRNLTQAEGAFATCQTWVRWIEGRHSLSRIRGGPVILRMPYPKGAF
jgi:hypothetical protein